MFTFFFSSRRRHTSGALVTGVQTCALPISLRTIARSSPPLRKRWISSGARGSTRRCYATSPTGPIGHPIHDQSEDRTMTGFAFDRRTLLRAGGHAALFAALARTPALAAPKFLDDPFALGEIGRAHV